MSFAVSILVLTSFIAIAFYYWCQLYDEEGPGTLRSFRIWVFKGVIVPILLWILFNSGLFMAPIMPDVELAKFGGGGWYPAMWKVTSPALSLVGSCWAAVTSAWMISIVAGRVESRRDFIAYSIIWSIFLIPLAGLILYFSGWMGLGVAVVLWLLPILNSTLPLARKARAVPLYSGVIAKMKFGKYDDAETEVIRELEKCDDDFEGWTLLADLYANHFGDLGGADRTIHETCNQPNVTASQISVALHRLADWHLKIGEDPVAARRVLDEICQRLPDTHLDRMARQRINRLPATPDEWRQQQKGRTVRLPALADDFERPPGESGNELDRQQAKVQANQCVEKLKRDPDNVPAREELARIFADRLGKVELAIDQVELLLGMPDQPAHKTAEWLSLVAAWQIKYRRDEEAARQILERLIREFPQTPQAFAAQRRLMLMDVELKMRKMRATGGDAKMDYRD